MFAKYIIFISTFLIVGVFMSPLNHKNSHESENQNSHLNKNGLESLLAKDASLFNLRGKLNHDNEVEDELTVEDLLEELDEQDLEDLNDQLHNESDNDYDGKIITKKSAPRRIFIGKRSKIPSSGGKRSGQIHRIFIGKRGDIKRIFIG